MQLIYGPEDKHPDIASEAYLYAEKEDAIVNMTLLSQSRDAPD